MKQLSILFRQKLAFASPLFYLNWTVNSMSKRLVVGKENDPLLSIVANTIILPFSR